MAHHVAVGEVEDDHIVIAALNALDGLRGDLGGAHLRLEVIGGHLGGGDQTAVLAREHLLSATVEEESHMGVLLRLGNAELSIALAGDILAEDIGQLPVGEGHQHIGHGGVILGSTHIGHREVALFPLHVGEGGVHKAAGDLPRPVGAEVDKDDGVAPGHGVVGPLHPVPALVPVHGVVAAHDGGHLAHAHLFALFHQLFHIALAGSGGHVPAVQEAVDIHPA